MITCAVWNWHTPYLHLLATALPDYHFHTLPTPHVPAGWRHDQRPQPDNVTVHAAFPLGMDVVLLQTAADFAAVPTAAGGGLPWVLLSHNRAELEPDAHRLAAWCSAHVVPLVCISERKAASWRAAGYRRADTLHVLEPGIRVEDYPAWSAEASEPHLLTVCNGLSRPLFDLASWLAVTEGLPVRLVGEGNEGIPGTVGPAPSWEALQGEYRRARVYLNPTAPPWEDADNLASIEARACGMPVLSLHGWARKPSPDAIAHVRHRLALALDSQRHLAASNRQAVAQRWSLERFGRQWRQVFEEACRG